jgi:phosphoribosylformimino-5-aminoimidazole carboxamide ribotide isomerase
VRQVFCTDISKDGLLQGAAVELYKQIIERLPEIKLIASGGVSSIADVYELEKIGCSGVIVGKAIYEGKISLEELKNVS